MIYLIKTLLFLTVLTFGMVTAATCDIAALSLAEVVEKLLNEHGVFLVFGLLVLLIGLMIPHRGGRNL